MSVDAKIVKELRDKTGAGMMDCKKALTESGGDMEKAIDFLRTKGLAAAKKRAGRATNEGLVYSYLHPGGKVGVLVEIACETDFVARTDEFIAFCKDVAMHVAAASPLAIDAGSISAEVIAKEREIAKQQALESGKPENIIDKIIEGRVAKFYKEVCLLEQAFVKDPNMTVKDLLDTTIGNLGENMSVRRFVRFQLGEEL